jgi:predicted glycogen debranching enzyme
LKPVADFGLKFSEGEPGLAERLGSLEWLECNGLGGWASSTLKGSHSRRYHGLLVAAMQPPGGRMVLLSKLDETLDTPQGPFQLSSNEYPGVTQPQGWTALRGFSLDPLPRLEYALPGGARLVKTLAALQGENSLVIRYELFDSAQPMGLTLLPLVAVRDYHSLSHANNFLRRDFEFKDGVLRLQPYDAAPEFFVSVPGSSFREMPDWFYRFQYARESERGLDFEEDLFSHGRFSLPLAPGRPLCVLASTGNPRGRDAAALFSAENARRAALPPSGTALARRLGAAADQFLVRRGESLKTVIAGYPWFMDWGRDTMVALRGLCLSRGRFDEAKKILEAFLGSLSQGMLPNRFPEAGESPEYNTADATLWLFVAAHDFWRLSQDRDFVLGRCLPALREILGWHRKGTRYGIKVDADGLLMAGEAGVQLTWMDAKVGDWVVTPRQGKAVEINALWINALKITAGLCLAGGLAPEAKSLEDEAARALSAFEAAFWNPTLNCCYDVLGSGAPDASLRPNQIFCLSLPFPLLSGAKAEAVLGVVTQKLLTPRGLRSLSPDDPRYRGRYEGGVAQRDGSYHQGTVWSWLLGPYIEAVIRLHGEAGRAQAKALLEGFAPHLDEAGLGTVSEIFDGDAPHAPRGCIAQAWSVGELLRVIPLLG